MKDVKSYLDKKAFSYNVNGDEAVMNCPFCNDRERKFSINLKTGLYQCWHKNKCGEHGGLYDFKRKLGDEVIFHQKKEYIRPKPKGSTPKNNIYDWFEKRNIEKKIVDRFNIRQEGNSVVFPYYRDGNLINQKYRTADKKFRQEKDAEQALFGMDLIPNDAEELIIFEGEIDCMSAAQLGFEQSVSVPAGATNLNWIEDCFEWLSRFRKIYLAFDDDGAGEDGARKAAKRLGFHRCDRVRFPYKDLNEALQNGIKENDVIACFGQAVPYAPETVRLAEDFYQAALEDEPEGTESGFDTLDNLLGGFRPGEVTVWTGRDGDGKSTFMNQLMLNIILRDLEQKVLFGSFEMLPVWLLRWMVKQAGIFLSESGLEEFRRLTGGRIAFIDTRKSVVPDELLEAFEYCSRRFGTQNFVIDSLLKVDVGSGPDWLDKQREFMNRLCNFALVHGVHVHLLAHPRKPQKDDERIYKADIAGSKNISDLAFNVISIRRLKKDKPEDPAGILEVMKNRMHGRLGVVMLQFDERKKQFKETGV